MPARGTPDDPFDDLFDEPPRKPNRKSEVITFLVLCSVFAILVLVAFGSPPGSPPAR